MKRPPRADRPTEPREQRGRHNELGYYDRTEEGPQGDSGGREAPGPVSQPPSREPGRRREQPERAARPEGEERGGAAQRPDRP